MDDFSDKKITLMGLGVLGRGVNVARFLLEKGANLIVTDLKSAEDLQTSIDQLASYENQIEYVLERHRVQDFTNVDLVIKSAGVSKDNKYIQAALAAGVQVKMDASWLCQLLPESVITIGVTGTKGKSSVAHLVNHLLKTAGKKVWLAGNIKGQASLPLLDSIKDNDILVMELDSWQLQGFHDEKISPNIAVFTNFMPDHLNYYKDMQDYFFDKSAIYLYQTKNDYLVLSPSSYEAYRNYGAEHKILSTVAIIKPHTLHRDWEYSQIGLHNRHNAAMAYQVAKLLDLDDETIRSGLASFNGVPGRLELVRQTDGYNFYNDTNATTPDATALSIKAVSEEYGRKINLICGGVNKGFRDFDQLIQVINRHCQHVVLLPGGIADRIKPRLTIKYQEADSMSDAVGKIYNETNGGATKEIVLMSPAGSSFGLFKNEYDRGEQFVECVRNLS